MSGQQLQLLGMLLFSCTVMAALADLEVTAEALQQAAAHLKGVLLAMRVPLSIIWGGFALALVQAQRRRSHEEIAAAPRHPYAVAAARPAPATADMALHHLQYRQFEALMAPPPPLIRLHG
jgi:hypothetical protein